MTRYHKNIFCWIQPLRIGPEVCVCHCLCCQCVSFQQVEECLYHLYQMVQSTANRISFHYPLLKILHLFHRMCLPFQPALTCWHIQLEVNLKITDFQTDKNKRRCVCCAFLRSEIYLITFWGQLRSSIFRHAHVMCKIVYLCQAQNQVHDLQ